MNINELIILFMLYSLNEQLFNVKCKLVKPIFYNKNIFDMIWGLPSVSELTPYKKYPDLTHLVSDTSVYE